MALKIAEISVRTAELATVTATQSNELQTTSPSEYKEAMRSYINLLENNNQGDQLVLNDPGMQHPNAMMPHEIIRKKLPNGNWIEVEKNLKLKEKMKIPTFKQSPQNPFLEAIDTRDLAVGNILFVVDLDFDIGDIHNDDGTGVYYEPRVYAFEVTETGSPIEANSLYGACQVKEISMGPNLDRNLLRYCNGEAHIHSPMIALGLPVYFSELGYKGRSPNTGPVQRMIVFENETELHRFVSGQSAVESSQLRKLE